MKKLPTIFILLLLILLLKGCAKNTHHDANTEEIICVKAEKLLETNFTKPIQCSGIVSSKRLIKLSFKTGGLISRIFVDEGSLVKKGQLIAELDMTEISSQVEQAKLSFEKAKRDLQRIKSLYNDTVATLEQYQNASSAYELAKENKNIAEFNQQYSAIKAPANGKIISKLAEEYELVGSGMPIIIFSEQGKDEWVIKAGVSDIDIVKIRKGDKAEVFIDAFPGQAFSATVSQISEAADPLSGTFEVEIAVHPENKEFKNGLVANVKIESKNSNTVTLVPPNVLIDLDGLKGYVFVFNKNDSTAKKTPVTIAYLQKNNVAVVEPINNSGLIITKGAAYLENGSKVKIVK